LGAALNRRRSGLWEGLARERLRRHSATAKQYCPSSSAVARHFGTRNRRQTPPILRFKPDLIFGTRHRRSSEARRRSCGSCARCLQIGRRKATSRRVSAGRGNAGVVDSGRERGHVNIDASDPERSLARPNSRIAAKPLTRSSPIRYAATELPRSGQRVQFGRPTPQIPKHLRGTPQLSTSGQTLFGGNA
jgi:hypothetical protein